MSPQRKKIIFFVILSFCFLFLLNKNIVYGNGPLAAPLPQGSVQKPETQPGKMDHFMRNFCHEASEYDGSWGLNSSGVKNLGLLLKCLFLYIISLPARAFLWLVVMFFWILVWLMAVLAQAVNKIFITIIGVSLVTSNLNPENIPQFIPLLNFTKSIGNGLVVLAGVVIGLATVLRIEEYSIRKHFGKLIALIVLVNYSHYIVVACATTANSIAAPFYNAFTKNQLSINIIKNIWDQSQNALPVSIPGELKHAEKEKTQISLALNTIPGTMTDFLFLMDSYFYKNFTPILAFCIGVIIYLYIYFTMFFVLLCCFIYFSLYGFIRIFVILILSILAPLAFSTIIFEKSRVYKVLFPGFLKWDNWLQSVLTWSFLIVPMLFIFFFGDVLYNVLSDPFDPFSITHKLQYEMWRFMVPTSTANDEMGKVANILTDMINQIMKTFATMVPVIVLFIFYALAFAEVKEQIKNMMSAIVGNLMGGMAGLGAMTGMVIGTAGIASTGIATTTGAVGGFLSGLGQEKLGSVISGIGQWPAKALSVAGAQGKAWSQKAKSLGGRAQTIGTKVGTKASSIRRPTLGGVTGGTVGALVGGTVGTLLGGPIGTIIGGAIGGGLGRQTGKEIQKEGLKKAGGKLAGTLTGAAVGAGVGTLAGGPLGAVIGAITGGGLGRQAAKEIQEKNWGRVTTLSGAAAGAATGAFLGPLGMGIGMGLGALTGGLGRALLGKFLKIKPSTPEDLRNFELDASNIRWRDASDDGLLTGMRAATSRTTKLRMALALAQRWGQLDQAQRETFNKELNNIEAQNTFNISDIALLEEIYPRTGRKKPPAFEIKKREAAITSLQNKKALPMEKAAAVKILADSDQPLRQEEVSLVSQALPYVQLDRDSAMKLALKAPSLAPQLDLSIERVVAEATMRQQLTQIPAFELPKVYPFLDQRAKNIILNNGDREQQTQMIELMLKDIDASIHHQYQVFIKGENPRTSDERFRAASSFLLDPRTHKNIEEIIKRKIAEAENDTEKKIIRQQIENTYQSMVNIANPYLRQRQNP